MREGDVVVLCGMTGANRHNGKCGEISSQIGDNLWKVCMKGEDGRDQHVVVPGHNLLLSTVHSQKFTVSSRVPKEGMHKLTTKFEIRSRVLLTNLAREAVRYGKNTWATPTVLNGLGGVVVRREGEFLIVKLDLDGTEFPAISSNLRLATSESIISIPQRIPSAVLKGDPYDENMPISIEPMSMDVRTDERSPWRQRVVVLTNGLNLQYYKSVEAAHWGPPIGSVPLSSRFASASGGSTTRTFVRSLGFDGERYAMEIRVQGQTRTNSLYLGFPNAEERQRWVRLLRRAAAAESQIQDPAPIPSSLGVSRPRSKSPPGTPCEHRGRALPQEDQKSRRAPLRQSARRGRDGPVNLGNGDCSRPGSPLSLKSRHPSPESSRPLSPTNPVSPQLRPVSPQLRPLSPQLRPVSPQLRPLSPPPQLARAESGGALVMSGPLEKRGYWVRAWRPRFFVLTSAGFLEYYPSERDARAGHAPRGRIPVALPVGCIGGEEETLVKEAGVDQGRLALDLVVRCPGPMRGRTVRLGAPDGELRASWACALRQAAGLWRSPPALRGR